MKPIKAILPILMFMVLSGLCTAQLSGVWQTDAGGCYYLIQDGNEVWWSSTIQSGSQPYNVFHGVIAGNTLTGIWCDMPANPNRGYGQSISLNIENNNRMVKTASSVSYAGSVWTRTNGSCQGTGNWVTVHEHQGCATPQGVCRRYDTPIVFSSLNQGYVEATSSNSNWTLVLKGNLNGNVYSYQYFMGGPVLGTGRFNFSADFRSFTGTWEDVNGHKGVWHGQLK